MQNIQIEFHPPTDILGLAKAILDLGTVFAFFIVLLVILQARKRYPMIERDITFLPLIGFSIFGIISTAMDAFDEWFWFTPKEFYDFVWKPTRLSLLLIGIFMLIFAFRQFYAFSKRLLGEEQEIDDEP
ncbi:MAG: membrane protein of unknown function [Candidatus Thorarchaeota archaeon]|nr:MAG: membrane protein of unknown function [Candidatus Thorarchaeota archaeon]